MSDMTPTDQENIIPVSVEDEMRKSYLDYAMSVIVSRALPDVRDGLKPVHRRILFSMHENNYYHNKPYRKSARVVGDVIGKYHPHGDQAVYDALVRMAQEFSLRLPLADGQGNFGSIDGDPPAAMRYTEVRLTEVAGFLLDDLDKETVNFRPNYDNQEFEPVVLPAKLPNLLINGSGGIAVGMATNMPPHNLNEVITGCLALIDNPELSVADLIEYIPAPDFPTAGLIVGRSGAMSGYHTGRGSVTMRGRINIEERAKDRQSIIITEIPYQVNKAHLVEKIAELVRDKKIEGISDLRDESDRQGMRVVVDLKKDANSEVIINQLCKWTQLQTNFSMNMLALHEGRPEQLDLKEILAAFIAFREEVVVRRTKFELNKSRERAHILVGLAAAVANLDEVVTLIKASEDPKQAKAALLARRWNAGDMVPYIRLVDDPRHPIDEAGFYTLSERQAQAILDLRLHRLTALGRDDITTELKKLADAIADYLDILASRDRIMTIIKNELVLIRDKFSTPRKSEIIEYDGDMEDEDLIPSEEMIVTVTKAGYVMRVPVDTYRAQNRGGRGRSGMNTRDEDGLETIFTANTHDSILFFSDKGMVYKLKVWRLPIGSLTARGKSMVNLLPIASDERITTILCSPKDLEASDSTYVMFATEAGNVRRNPLSDFMNVRANGKIAMKLDEGDSLIGVKICHAKSDILLATAFGRIVRFHAMDIRLFKGRDSSGVRGVRLADGDRVVSIADLPNIDVTSEESAAYLKKMRALRVTSEDDDSDADEETTDIAINLDDDRLKELAEHSVMLLTISDKGFGKRTDSFAYRRMNRGGQGSAIMKLRGDAQMIAAYPVADTDDVIAATDGGQVIRFRACDISIQSRTAGGVTLVRVGKDEKIVSVTVIPNDDVDLIDEHEVSAGTTIETPKE
ncbi:MAG: DNA gyrase subunit A [Alphaproteobacteria bacterium]|jgi:DNA gyrase subunit A